MVDHVCPELLLQPQRALESNFSSFPFLCMCFIYQQCMHAQSFQTCPTVCDPMDCSPPASSVHGILQARILEWVVMPFSRGSSQLRDQVHNPMQWKHSLNPLNEQGSPCPLRLLIGEKKQRPPSYFLPFISHMKTSPLLLLLLLLLSRFSCVRLCATPQTEAHQAPPSLVFSRQEHWSGLPFPSPTSPSLTA